MRLICPGFRCRHRGHRIELSECDLHDQMRRTTAPTIIGLHMMGSCVLAPALHFASGTTGLVYRIKKDLGSHLVV